VIKHNRKCCRQKVKDVHLQLRREHPPEYLLFRKIMV
jgi:hypothetical protein